MRLFVPSPCLPISHEDQPGLAPHTAAFGARMDCGGQGLETLASTIFLFVSDCKRQVFRPIWSFSPVFLGSDERAIC